VCTQALPAGGSLRFGLGVNQYGPAKGNRTLGYINEWSVSVVAPPTGVQRMLLNGSMPY